VVTLNTGSGSMLSGTASGNRGVNINGVASTTTVTGGSAAAASTVSLGATVASMNTATAGGGGLVVTDITSAKLTGGSVLNAGSMTLTDNQAKFSNPAGADIKVTGVADGNADPDAVNYRQLKALEKLMSQGIASTAAMANVPQVDQDKTFSVGLGVGTYNSQSAFALGASYRFLPNAVVKGSIGTSTGKQPVFGIGASMSW
jgi:hypothetical protein